MKDKIRKFRFFFRRKLYIADFTCEMKKELKELSKELRIEKLSLTRIVNNRLYGFKFIGIYPVFKLGDSGFHYFSEYNEID